MKKTPPFVEAKDAETLLTPVYGRGAFRGELYLQQARLPEEPTAPDTVYEIIRNEVLLDARAELNLATFCNEAYSDPYGEQVVIDSMKKNFIDHTEYPGTNLSEARSLVMMARELGADVDEAQMPGEQFLGSATIGSSEAVMLGLIAHKFIWNMKHRVLMDWGDELGIPADPRDRPVVLMSAHMHGCWDKFCRYYDAYPLYVEVDGAPYALHDGTAIERILKTRLDDSESRYARDIREAMGYSADSLGDRTIGDLVMCVGTVVGSTFTGNFDNVSAIDDSVDMYCRRRNAQYTEEQRATFEEKYMEWYRSQFQGDDPTRIPEIVDIPIHVDAAGSGFVLMFSSNGRGLKFNFRDCPKRVRSINVSNHKFGMTFTGMGSVVFKDDKVVDRSLVYDITYLGGQFTDYTVNFSRGSSMILMQYYNFLRFGRAGYRAIMDNCLDNTRWFLERLSNDDILGSRLKNISNLGIRGHAEVFLPFIALTWEGEEPVSWNLDDLSMRLSQAGWFVPAYHIPRRNPHDTKGIEVLRIIVQQVVSREKLEMLLIAMRNAVKALSDNEPQYSMEIVQPTHTLLATKRSEGASEVSEELRSRGTSEVDTALKMRLFGTRQKQRRKCRMC